MPRQQAVSILTVGIRGHDRRSPCNSLHAWPTSCVQHPVFVCGHVPGNPAPFMSSGAALQARGERV